MRRLLFALVSVITPVWALAGAGYVDGQQLNGWLKDYDSLSNDKSGAAMVNAGSAHGFVMGVVDSVDGIVFCIPPNVKAGQLGAMAAKYVRDHPERWNENGAALVVDAIRPTFPCPKK